MSTTLVPFEIRILRECADADGDKTPWGAAVGQALEVLWGSGYLDRGTGKPTPKGLEFLKALGGPGGAEGPPSDPDGYLQFGVTRASDAEREETVGPVGADPVRAPMSREMRELAAHRGKPASERTGGICIGGRSDRDAPEPHRGTYVQRLDSGVSVYMCERCCCIFIPDEPSETSS